MIVDGGLFKRSLAGLCVLGLSACDLSDEIERSRETPVIADNEVAQEPAEDVVIDENVLPEAVSKTKQEIMDVLERKSISRMVRLASKNPDFRSNYGGISHYDHWYILRRAGLDPIAKTQEILSYPHGVKDFGVEKFYIWPYFAVREPEDLEYSRLSFTERAELLPLVGEDGMERIANGEPYPGFRLAIREDGTWVYLLQDN